MRIHNLPLPLELLLYIHQIRRRTIKYRAQKLLEQNFSEIETRGHRVVLSRQFTHVFINELVSLHNPPYAFDYVHTRFEYRFFLDGELLATLCFNLGMQLGLVEMTSPILEGITIPDLYYCIPQRDLVTHYMDIIVTHCLEQMLFQPYSFDYDSSSDSFTLYEGGSSRGSSPMFLYD